MASLGTWKGSVLDGAAHTLAGFAPAIRRMAAQDWMLLAYHVVLLGPTFSARRAYPAPFFMVLLDLAWLVGVLLVVRGLDRRSVLPSAVYRVTLVALPLASYIQLRWILPAVVDDNLDAELLAFDLRIFGYEPALAWDRWVTPVATEWFSFFYYSYFVILAVHAIPIALFAADGKMLREFAFGLLMLFCVGHVGYLIVPGLGPHVHVDRFVHALEGEFFWPLVRDAVESAGAPGDIFPSLHTAVPVFLTLFSFRHRRRLPFRFTWPIMGVFASQIVIATMYLRWHWLADIAAGVGLAVVSSFAARSVARIDGARRARDRVAPAFGAPIRLPWTAPTAHVQELR
jgi:hypothetical protein